MKHIKPHYMKKILVAAALLLFIAVTVGCKEKRCKCTTLRAGETPAIGLEPLGTHSDCSELNADWEASDSTGDLLTKVCVPEE